MADNDKAQRDELVRRAPELVQSLKKRAAEIEKLRTIPQHIVA